MREPLHWLTQSLVDVPEDDEWLSVNERAILAGMRFPKRRSDWRLGRWTAKRAIRAYQRGKDIPLTSLEIRAAPDGAPEAFWSGGQERPSISISHSDDRSLCVVGPGNLAVGCDLERIEAREDSLMQDYFTSEEISFAQEVHGAELNLAVNLIWSAKESSLKILREGLRRDTRSICIHTDFSRSKESWDTWTGRCLESSRVFCGWWRTCDGFVYTLASDQITSSPKQLQI
jgi:4'-phosphopantetheinyl transferase